MTKISESLTIEEKTVIQILGKYQDIYKNSTGMLAGDLEREASRKIKDPRPVLRNLMRMNLIKGRDADYRDMAVQLWGDYINNSDRESLETLLAYNEEDVVNL